MPISFRDLKSYVVKETNGQQTPCSGALIESKNGTITAFLVGSHLVDANDVVIDHQKQLINLHDGALLHSRQDKHGQKLLSSHVELIGLSVITLGGDQIGTIIDVEFNPMLGNIMFYRVKPELTRRIMEWLKHLHFARSQELLISQSLVIEIRPTELVIKDDVEQQTEHVRLVKARALGFDA